MEGTDSDLSQDDTSQPEDASVQEDLDTTSEDESQTDSDGGQERPSALQINETAAEDDEPVYKADETYLRSGEQFVGDNVDIQMTSPYGLRSVHAMGRIRVVPEASIVPEASLVSEETNRKKVSTAEKSNILKNLEISIRPYYPKKTDGFKSVTFLPLADLLRKIGQVTCPCPGDVSWLLGWLLKMRSEHSLSSHSNWKGFMKTIYKAEGADKSAIEFLTVIDNPPDNYSTVYTTLAECMNVAADSPMIITLDLPLWTKATRIILECDMPIIPRLGGFHQLQSYTGAMGYLMTGSGIEECFKVIFPNFPVDKLLSGKAHYKTLRAYLLIDAAFFIYIMDEVVSEDELAKVYDYIQDRKEDKDGAYVETQFITEITQQIKHRLEDLEKSGKTQKLWTQHHKLVQLMRDYIRAERTSDAAMYLKCTAGMLPIVMAAGHTQYGKALRFTLQQFLKLGGQVKYFFLNAKHHTVKYSSHEWSGIWSDLSIEQTLMRYCKSIGGLSGGRLRTESSKKVWLLTLASFTEIHRGLEAKQHIESSDHTDLGKKRLTEDYEKILKLVDWFKTTGLLDTDPQQLVSFQTGEISTDDAVNCHQAHDVGMEMQTALDGQTFISKVAVKSKCKNFSILRKAVTINKKAVILAPYVLFQRMAVAAERKLTLKDSLAFELTTEPASLFNSDHFMRESHKAKLGQHLKDTVSSKEPDPSSCSGSSLVIDGGWLVHMIPWKTNQLFADIVKSYVNFVKHLANGRRCVVVFDGYGNSPKDHEHRRRMKNGSGAIQVILDANKICTMTKQKFLSCTKNKEQFITLLCTDLAHVEGIETCVAQDDCDTLIVKKALELGQTMPVDVRAEDTDVLVMLIHHMPKSPNDIHMCTKAGSYSISSIRKELNEVERERLLFIHSFSGCDTVSSIYRQSKVGLLKKLCEMNEELVLKFATLLSLDPSKQKIIDAGLHLFQLIYGDANVSLKKHRYNKYHQMTAKSILRPEGLPPTDGAATQHTLRAYLQYRDWLLLGSMTVPPTDFGWFVDSSGKFAPVTTIDTIAPPELLKLTACDCKKGCKAQRCSCRSMGVKCIAACSTCNGRTCTNIEDDHDSETE